MYEFLEGDLAEKTPSRIVLAVNGVGFLLAVPVSTFGKLPAKGKVRLLTHLHTNEEGPRLFGFATAEERDLFRLLLSVSGVGPQTALALLSQLAPAELAAAVAHDDSDRLRQVKGVGEKTAKRILLELKEKLPKLGIDPGRAVIHPPVIQDAISALVSIGYERREAELAVSRAHKKVGTTSFDDLVKCAMGESRG